MKSLVLLLALAATSEYEAAGMTEFDPIALAVDALTQQGIPPPAGHDIRPAQPGELPGTEIAHTYPGEIAVDLRQLGLAAKSPQELVDLVEAVLVHEYGHCEGDGNNGLCAHQRLYGAGLDHLCEVIEQRQAAGLSTEALCWLDRTWTDVFNGIWCYPPQSGRRFPCNACG